MKKKNQKKKEDTNKIASKNVDIEGGICVEKVCERAREKILKNQNELPQKKDELSSEKRVNESGGERKFDTPSNERRDEQLKSENLSEKKDDWRGEGEHYKDLTGQQQTSQLNEPNQQQHQTGQFNESNQQRQTGQFNEPNQQQQHQTSGEDFNKNVEKGENWKERNEGGISGGDLNKKSSMETKQFENPEEKQRPSVNENLNLK